MAFNLWLQKEPKTINKDPVTGQFYENRVETNEKKQPESIEKSHITEAIIKGIITDSVNQKNTSKSSYVQIFEDYLWAKFCKSASSSDPNSASNSAKSLLQINEYNINPLDHFIIYGSEATIKQKETWANLFNDCEKLALKYPEEYILFHIKKLLNETKTTTENEASLKKAFKKVQEFKNLVIEMRKIDASKDMDEIIGLQNSIMSMSVELDDYLDTPTPNEQNLQASAKIKSAKLKLEELTYPYLSAHINLVLKYTELHKQLYAQLKISHGNEFFFIFKAIEQGKRLYIDIITRNNAINSTEGDNQIDIPSLREIIYQNVYQENLIKDEDYFNSLYEPALALLACYKGFDCDQQSMLILPYCLGRLNKDADTNACNTDLQSYYYDYYLTKNQQMDLTILFNYLVENYD